MKRKYVLNLQLFADPNINLTTSDGMTAEMHTYYDKNLIDIAGPQLIHDQFADKRPIPQGSGKTIEFRKYDNLKPSLIPLQEGVTPNGNKLNVTTITATVEQYGDFVTVSDMLKMTAVDNNIVEATDKLGTQAGETGDCITRDVLAGGTNVFFAGEKDSRDELELTDIPTRSTFIRLAAALKSMNAPKFDGSYVALIHPQMSAEIMDTDGWIDITKYQHPEQIYEGEIGKIGGIRFVESTNCKIWKDDTCPAKDYVASEDTEVVAGKVYYTRSGSTGSYTYAKVSEPTGNPSTSSYYEKEPYAVFSTLVIGRGAYATTEVEGGGLQMIIKQLGAGDDPLNQRATVGWKLTKVSERLVEQYMIRLESLGKASKTIAAN